MNTKSKTILIAGLGRYGPAASASANISKVQADIRRANEAGYRTQDLELNPNDIAQSVSTVRKTLQSNSFDGFLVGFGVRGNKDFTPLFEDVVNASRETSPATKLLFGTAPDAVYETILRGFGKAGSEWASPKETSL